MQSRSVEDDAPLAGKKKYVSTTTFFKAAAERTRKRKLEEEADNAARYRQDRTAQKQKLGKSILAQGSLVSKPPQSAREPDVHPLVADLTAQMAAYRDTVKARSQDALKPVRDALVQRLTDGPSPGSPTNFQARIKRALQQSAAISAPLASHEVKVRFRGRDGSVTIGQVALGETVSRFEKLLEDKTVELDSLWDELAEVRVQIADLGADLLGDPPISTKVSLSLDDKTNTPSSAVLPPAAAKRIAELKDEIKAACQKTRGELDKLEKGDAELRKFKRNQWHALLRNDL